MRYLLDVNALISLGYKGHVFHGRTGAWAGGKSLVTHSISELGFVRILTQLPELNISVSGCQELLAKMKTDRDLEMLPDEQSAVNLPAWVRKPKQITDGHLVEVARANHASLATLDEGIPGGYLIPRG